MTTREISSQEFIDRRAEKVIAIASSKGGIKALETILNELPANFSASIIIVQHLSANFKSYLSDILNGKTSLKVQRAEEGYILAPGAVYVAPPDHHVIVNQDGSISLSHAEKEHFVRPSAEYTFKSLAENYRQKAIAIVLTGYDSDGSEGVREIKAMGGKVIAQDKETSQVFGMPQSAIKTGCVDLVLPLNKIADTIVNMVNN